MKLLPLLLLFPTIVSAQTLDLAGTWQFATDPLNVGLQEHWQNQTLTDSISLPGSMPERLKGDDVTVDTKWVGSIYDSSYYFNPYLKPYRQKDNIAIPFFLTPQKHYVGVAWYRKEVTLDDSWTGRHVTLFLERPHILSTVFVNGQEVGADSSLSVPHQFDVSRFVRKGKNVIAIRIDNDPTAVGVGQDSHSVTDQTQGCWNGIVGRIELRAQSKGWMEDVKVFPDVTNKRVRVKVRLGFQDDLIDEKQRNNFLKNNGMKILATLSLKEDASRGWSSLLNQSVQVDPKSDTLSFSIPLGEEMKLWSEKSPALYRLDLRWLDEEKSIQFGMREIVTKGKDILVNGEPVLFRGTVENCNFPLTGYPPTDKKEWLRILGVCKECGFNHVRFHSYCPPEAAFEAADELGIYLQPEGPSWPNHGVSLGRGEIIDRYLLQETQRMTDCYGNHPSFCMMAAGNEPRGNWVAWCSDFVDYWKKTDSRRIYTGASVGGGWQWQPKNQYHVKAGLRGLDWDRHQPHSDDTFTQQLDSFYDKATRTTFAINEPFVAHEAGQWCAFPDFSERRLYTGVYKARNFDIFEALLRDNGMASQARKFLHSSGKLQALCYKFEVEKFRRTPHYAGYQLLGLNDYSGQGTALVGMLNVFFKQKGYCSPEYIRQFNAPTALLAHFPKFTFLSSETVRVPVSVSNFSGKGLEGSWVMYEVTNEHGEVVTDGKVGMMGLEHGCVTDVGEVVVNPMVMSAPAKLRLTLYALLSDHLHRAFENSYDFWIYPQSLADQMEERPLHDGMTVVSLKSRKQRQHTVLVADSLTEEVVKTLHNGGKVLLTAAGTIRYGQDVVQTYLPVFWNTSWFKMRPPHTTGAYIDNSHPVFKDFPTDDWSNLNWWELLNHAQTMQLTEFPEAYQPIVQPIDTWHVSRKLGALMEVRVGKGRLMITTMDVDHDLEKRIVARQLRRSILLYMLGDDFQPSTEVDLSAISHLFTKEAPVLDMYTNDSPDELKPKIQ